MPSQARCSSSPRCWGHQTSPPGRAAPHWFTRTCGNGIDISFIELVVRAMGAHSSCQLLVPLTHDLCGQVVKESTLGEGGQVSLLGSFTPLTLKQNDTLVAAVPPIWTSG